MPATGSGEGGTAFLLDLPQATALRDGDGLVLDDSSIVRVVGRQCGGPHAQGFDVVIEIDECGIIRNVGGSHTPGNDTAETVSGGHGRPSSWELPRFLPIQR